MRDAQGRIPYNGAVVHIHPVGDGVLDVPHGFSAYRLVFRGIWRANNVRPYEIVHILHRGDFLNAKGNEMAAGATAVALVLSAQFEDVLELELFITLLLQVAYAMEVVALQRKRVEKLEGKKECPDDFFGPI